MGMAESEFQRYYTYIKGVPPYITQDHLFELCEEYFNLIYTNYSFDLIELNDKYSELIDVKINSLFL